MGESNTAENRIKPFRSLRAKTFFIVMAITLAIGVITLVAGFFIYVLGVFHEYYINTWNMANAEAVVMEESNARHKCDQIIKLYDSIPREERGDGQSEEYKARFKPLIDDEFRMLQKRMLEFKKNNGPLNAYIMALDKECDKMIYLIDSDPKEKTFVSPGTWDHYDREDLQKLRDGREPTDLQKKYEPDIKVHAVITNIPKYGLRCTGASLLYETGEYTVLVCTEYKLDRMVATSKVFLIQYLSLLFFATLVASLIGMIIMQKQLIKPIRRITKAAKEYGEHKAALSTEGKRFFDKLDIEKGDELGNLALNLKGMEDDLNDYADNLMKATAEKQTMLTELSVAANIQSSMLPDEFPPYPERDEFDIYASMEPARDVGGDFYDFHMIDDDHVGLVIADVSGKGIPAALLMMATMIIITGKMKEGLTPAEVLESVNDKICENNKAEMFVTVWLGVLEISTGKLTASNAGHEYPIIMKKDGSAEIYKDKHGFVIGGLPGMKYTNYEIDITPGQKVFVYTDGLTEATSMEKELFGMERIVDALEACDPEYSAKEVLGIVHEKVDEFVGENEQFDDLTMLCLEYMGRE